MKEYPVIDTSIDELLLLKNSDTIFLSGWDVVNTTKYEIDLETIIQKSIPKKNIYFFMDEFDPIKRDFLKQNDGLNKTIVSANNFAIATNGTNAAFLTLYCLNKKVDLRCLVLTPMYFSYLEILKDFNAKCFSIELLNAEGQCNWGKMLLIIKEKMVQNDINLLIITDPLFGTGIKIPHTFYQSLMYFCQQIDSYFLVDYIYGGMEWCSPNYLFNVELLTLVNQFPKMIIIDSISKNIFLNGLKSSIVYSHENLIKMIEKTSVYLSGSLSFPQIATFNEIYQTKNYSVVEQLITDSATLANQNYNLINSIILDSGILLSECTCGYYCLVGIPLNWFRNVSNATKEIMEKVNILTIPHDRYGFSSSNYYFFRTNLLLTKSSLTIAFEHLLRIKFD